MKDKLKLLNFKHLF